MKEVFFCSERPAVRARARALLPPDRFRVRDVRRGVPGDGRGGGGGACEPFFVVLFLKL